MSFTPCIHCADLIAQEGKWVHLCIVREDHKVVGREHQGWFDGNLIVFKNFSASSRLEVEVELDHYVSDLLRQTAIDTADMEAASQTPQEAPQDFSHINTPVSTLSPLSTAPGASCDILTMYQEAYGWACVELEEQVAEQLTVVAA